MIPLATRSRLVHLLILGIVAGWGGYVRLVDLGQGDLTLEELNHYYVGSALAEGEGPVLPSGARYGRGVEYSRFVELTGRFVEDRELAVRLPSAVLGAASIAVVAGGTYGLAGPIPAIGATLLHAVHPQAVIQARTGRFYMLQLIPGLIALFVGWFAVRTPARAATRRERLLAIIAGVASTLALLLSIRYQVTGVTSLFAWWVFLAVTGILDLRSVGWFRWWRSAPALLAAAIAAAGSLLFVVRPYIVPSLLVRAFSTPYWARANETSWSLYYDGLAVGFPLIGIFSVAAFAVLARKRPRLAAYLGTMFLVPALLLSFVLPFKADRFLLLAAPALFVAIGIGLSDAAELLRDRLAVRGQGAWGAPPAHGTVVAGLFGLLLFGSFPAVAVAGVGYSRISSMPAWSAARAVIASRPDLAGAPLGASRSLPARFYWGRVDFSIAIGHLEHWDPDFHAAIGRLNEGSGAYLMADAGTPDMYAGVPVLPTAASIFSRFGGRDVLIAVDDYSVQNSMVDADLLRTLRTEAIELCERRCGPLRLYHWRPRHMGPVLLAASSDGVADRCGAGEGSCAPEHRPSRHGSVPGAMAEGR